MSGSYQQPGGVGLIILLVILYIIFNSIGSPIDDAVVAAPLGAGLYSSEMEVPDLAVIRSHPQPP